MADIEESKDLKLSYKIKNISMYYFFMLESEKMRKIAELKRNAMEKWCYPLFGTWSINNPPPLFFIFRSFLVFMHILVYVRLS